MRGIALFFMIICMFGGLGLLVLSLNTAEAFAQADLVGQAMIAFACFFAALAAWHASRVGAGIVLLLQLVTPATWFFGVAELTPTDWGRSLIYIVLATVLTWSAIRYVSESEAKLNDIAGSGVVRWIGKILSGGVVAVIGFGIAIIVNGIPTEVQKGSEISETHLEWLREQNFLLPDEKPLFFYIDGAFSIEDGGSLLTDRYVGGWVKTDGEVSSSWIKLGEVCDVEVRNEGSFFEDAVYYVYSPGKENWTELWLSIEGDKHERFVSRLKALNKRLMTPEVRTFCDEDRVIDWVEIAAMNGISADVVGSDDVTPEQMSWLQEQKYILPEEKLINFYSYGIYDVEEGGVLLTDQYFGGWYINDDEPAAWWGALGTLCGVLRMDDTEGESHVLYEVSALENSGINLSLPKSSENVDAMIATVLQLNDAAKSTTLDAECLSQLEAATED